jgi:hypothetical protein
VKVFELINSEFWNFLGALPTNIPEYLSRFDPFVLDNWMARFLTKHSSPLADKRVSVRDGYLLSMLPTKAKRIMALAAAQILSIPLNLWHLKNLKRANLASPEMICPTF